MPDFNKHSDVLMLIKDAQSVDTDEREQAREARHFLDKRDGQWEPEIWNRYGTHKRPRYTLDKCNPIVNQIVGELKKADFAIKISPANSYADDDSSDLIAGMIRNIENLSKASHIYSFAAKNMVGTGIDGWMVKQDWADDESFDQDLFIKPIYDFVNSVWFDPDAKERDRSDAKWAVRLVPIDRKKYEKKWPDASGTSIAVDRTANVYTNKPDTITVAEFYWIETKPVVLVQMNNGSVFREDELEPIKDELAEKGITEKARRTRQDRVVMTRKMDGGDWLDNESETAFSWIPIIPTYANYNVSENKTTYHGAVEKLMDAQRIYNYARSRQIEEGALSPRDKYWMTEAQAAGHEDTLRTLNTNADPVQFYKPDPKAPPPYKGGPAQVNPALSETAMSAREDITQGSGLFNASMGDNPGLQSGVAIEALQERGDTGTYEYFEAQEVAICHTARILIDAIPKVYDTQRQIRLVGEDGAVSTEIVNQVIMDEETKTPIMINDLSRARYSIACSAGKSFSSRQQESVAAITEMAQLDPSVVTEGGDVLLKNTNAPGLDIIAERKRIQLINAGVIPESQWTDEERQKIEQARAEAANQPQEPSPEMVLAMAEEKKAQADIMAQQIKQQELSLDAARVKIEGQKVEIEKLKLTLDAQNSQLKAENDRLTTLVKAQETGANTEKIQADTAKTVQEISDNAADQITQFVENFNRLSGEPAE